MFDLSGKTALVTGGSYGLGVTFAEALAGAGADLALMARSADLLEGVRADLSARFGRTVTAHVGDVTSDDDAARVTAEAVAAHGKIDVLVNNAGISDVRVIPSEHFDSEMFRKILDVDVTGLFIMAREVGRHMLEQGKGSIINISSIFGDGGCEGVTPAYFAAKGAVTNLTKLLAVEWGDRGVRVNALSPHFFMSEMTKPFLEQLGLNQWWSSRTPMRRIGEGPDLVGPVVFLASDESGFVSGVNLPIDGGFNASRGAWQVRPPHWDWNEANGPKRVGKVWSDDIVVEDSHRKGIPGLHYPAE